MENTQIKLSDLSTEELELLLEAKRSQEAKAREDKKSAYESLRDETVHSLCKQAKNMSAALASFKSKSFSDMQALHALLIEHSKIHADGKGNFTAESADGQYRIKYTYQENGRFDERSVQAERHISDFVKRHFDGQADTQELITKLLERKKGQFDIKLVQKLYAMEDRFQDEAWREGIRLLKESWQPTDTKAYINFYQRGEHNEWVAILLNFASV